MSTTIAFRDANGIEYIDYLTHGTSLAAIEAYAQDIAQYSHAAIPDVTYTQGKAIADLPAQGTGAYADVRLLAKIFMRDNETHVLYCATIRAPKEMLFIDTADGVRVKKSVGEAITAKYAILAGRDFTFEHGALAGSTQ